LRKPPVDWFRPRRQEVGKNKLAHRKTSAQFFKAMQLVLNMLKVHDLVYILEERQSSKPPYLTLALKNFHVLLISLPCYANY
jgi:hypothetical protein